MSVILKLVAEGNQPEKKKEKRNTARLTKQIFEKLKKDMKQKKTREIFAGSTNTTKEVHEISY